MKNHFVQKYIASAYWKHGNINKDKNEVYIVWCKHKQLFHETQYNTWNLFTQHNRITRNELLKYTHRLLQMEFEKHVQ